MLYTVLFLAKNWPEPNSTAAGRRTLDLLDLFAKSGCQIHVACAADVTPFQHDLVALGMHCHTVSLNDSSFETFVESLSPDLVIYDRFVTEEQFGWRVRLACPNAMTLLDTSDLHCLRKAREDAFKKGTDIQLNSDTALREIASIVRCDLTLMISATEQTLLQQQFNVSADVLATLPFLVDENDFSFGETFQTREHCVMIGGFKHEPNRDATRWLRNSLWPAIRKQLPKGCELHVYGAYADHAMNQLHQPKEGFYIKGRIDDALQTLSQYRLNLAPLRFGAGQKGKILEGWLTGTPTITNAIGAESMATQAQLCYPLPESENDFAQLCGQLYSDEAHWQIAVQNGHDILRASFLREHYTDAFMSRVTHIYEQLATHRQANFWGQMLWQNQFRATEYMSRWIELKNAPKPR